MKLFKQTIYLPTEYDLEDYNISEKTVDRFVFTEEELNQFLSDVIKKTLDIASENAETGFDSAYNIIVDKNSITNSYTEVYQQFKV